MQYVYRKLKGRIKEVFGTQANFALVIGLSRNSVCKKLKGKSEFSQSDIERWAKFLNIERKDFGEFFFM